MSAERIDTLDDPRIACFRDVRDRDLRRSNLFMAEGRFVVRTLLASSLYDTHAVLVTPTALESMTDLLAGRERVYVAEQALVNEIVGFNMHRGCLAAGLRRDVPSLPRLLDALPATGPLMLVVLEDLTNHDNVGALFRTALAFDAAGVVVTGRTCDPLYRKAIRVSMGAALRLPFAVVDDLAVALEAFHRRDIATLALTPGAQAHALEDVPPTPRLALLLGEEGPGLSQAVMRRASRCVRIDTGDGVDSLNVAAAGAIAMHAFTPRRSRPRP